MASEQIVSYVLRYGGNCRDCADADGICPNTDMPCGFELKTAVIKHTLKALEYGISHGFIADPFTRSAPAATDTGLVTVGYAHRGTIGLLLEGVVSKAVIVPKAGGDFKTPVMLVEQAEELLAAEREWAKDRGVLAVKLALENSGLQGQIDTLKADNAAQAARIKELEQRSCDNGFCNTDHWYDRAKALEAKLAAAEKALEARDALINNLAKHVDALPDDAEFVGSAAKWASRLALMLGELRTVPEVPTILRSKVAEYIAARNDYELATKPNGSFGTVRHLKPNNPISVRYREARAALEAKP